MVSVLRPGQRILNIPGIGVQTSRRAVASGAADWWAVAGKTCIAAYQPKGAASLAASYSNLANPGTYDATPGVAPTFDAATGWEFDGSSTYLTCGLTNTTSWSALVQFSDVPGENLNLFLFGAYSGSGHFGIVPILGTGGNHSRYYINGGDLVVANKVTSGNMAIAGNAAYLDGVPEGTIGGGGAPGGTLYIGARHRIDTSGIDSYVAAKVQAIVFYSDTLTTGEVATVSAAMAAL